MWYFVVFQPSKCKKTHFQPQIWSIWPIFPNDSESLPKFCYIKQKTQKFWVNSEILSRLGALATILLLSMTLHWVKLIERYWFGYLEKRLERSKKRSFRGNELNLLINVSHFSQGKKLSCNKLCAPFCCKRVFAVLRVIFAVREKNVPKFSTVTVSLQRLDNPLLPCIAIHLDIHLRYEWSLDFKESINFLEDNGFRIHVKWTPLKMERLYDISFWVSLQYVWWVDDTICDCSR